MYVQPGVGYFVLIDLTGAQEGLSVVTVHHVPVIVHIVEGVVLTYGLGLVVELLRRLEVVDPDVGNGIHVFRNGCRCQGIVCSEALDIHVTEVICVLCIFYIVQKIRCLLLKFVRRNDEVLNQRRKTCSKKAHNDHQYGDGQKLLVVLFVHVQDEENRCHH